MSNRTSPCKPRSLLLAALAAALPLAALPGTTDISTVPLPTYSVGSTVDIKPNIMMVLDDSGSMDWTYLPDWANDIPPSYTSLPPFMANNPQFNGVAYNPAITYSPPISFTAAGTKDTSTYPSMDGSSTSKGADSSAKPNWNYVPRDGYGVQSSSRSNLTDNAVYYVTVPGEYCDSSALTSCTNASSATGNYQYPAPLRWCNGNDLTTCRATNNSSFNVPRMAPPRSALLQITSASSASVTGITVGGFQIMSGSTASTSTTTTLASYIVTKINDCTSAISGNCTVTGYSAARSNNLIQILAPSPTSATPVVGSSGSLSTTILAFALRKIPLNSWLASGGTLSSVIPQGDTYTVAITSTTNSYSYPGSAAKAPTRTDCAGTTCTYNEEMTNYANWYAYYRTRMQMMKTSTSRAFASLDSDADIAAGKTRYRVGYMTINNNNSGDFVNIKDFDATQKNAWFTKLFTANPNNSTPLRQALSIAGRYYAGKYNGSSVYGVNATDPLQYSCQRNYTILSTDGFWNNGAGFKLNGSDSIGNQDAGLARPYNDGGSATVQQKTSNLQTRTILQTAQKGTLQKQTSQLQKATSLLQKSTGQLQKKTLTTQQRTLQIQQRVQQLQGADQHLQTRTSNNNGNSWTGWSDVTSCTPDNTGNSRRQCQWDPTPTWSNASSCAATAPNNGVQHICQTTDTGFVDASSCTASSGSGRTVTCQTTDSGWQNASSCSAGSANGATVTCQTLDSGWANSTSCTAGTVGAVQTLCQVIPISGPTTVTSCTAGNSSGIITSCSYGAWSTFADTGSCTAVAQSTGPTSYTVGTAVQCQTVVTSPFADSPSCSVTSANGSGVSTQCQYSFAAAAATATCSPTYTIGNYTNATVYTGCSTTNPPWTNAGSCTTSTYDASGQSVQCQYSAWSGWSTVGSCTAVDQSTGPNYTVGTAIQCQSLSSGGTSNTLADVAAYYYNTDLRSATAVDPDNTGTCTGPIIAPSSTANDLCANNVPPFGRDANSKQHMTTSTLGLGAQGQMVFSNYQNNLAGQRVYQPDYWQQQSGDFYAVANGSTANPSSGICPWMSSGSTCTWSTPSSDSINNIDDLWHAAVNGRGTYFSATDPQSLADSLKAALSQIVNTPRPGTAAAAASSNPNITSSDNFVFSSSYKSVEWYGELIMQQLASDGALGAQQWSAMRNLDCTASAWQANFAYAAGAAFSQGGACYVVNTDYTSGAAFDGTSSGADGANITLMTGVTPGTRTIYVAGGADPSGLTTFAWANLSAAQKAYFSQAALTYVDASTGITQFCTIGAACLSATAQADAAGSNLVAFLAGSRTYEGSYYRARKHVLGDIVSSEARYVKQPLQGYIDAGYQDFKTAKVGRTAMVYVGANDGMVHAFEGLTGKEAWAFIPSAVLPTMYHLADTDYANKHWYFVDGTPEVGDICPNSPAACSSTQWKTILVGGLNDGGMAYYALDITDPTAPKLLWQFTNANLGLSYSNPRITKLKDGTWVVIVASGYNNADGVGRLFVLNANTGALIRTISTGVGSAGTPSGLAKIAARAPTSATDNTVFQVYGGDLLGNVWRFDVNDDIGTSGYDAQLLVQLKDPSGNAQPITAKPTVASVNNYPMVMFGTGQYLGIPDLSSTPTNTMYAIIDRLGTSTLTTPRALNSNFVHQTMIDTTCPADAPATVCAQGQTVRTVQATSVDWSVQNGWYVDFVIDGERSVTDPTLALGTLAFTTIKPQTSTEGTVTSCTGTDTAVAATSYLYYLNYLTGGAVDGTKNVVGNLLCTCVATRPSVVRTQTGSVEAIIRTSGGGNSSGTDMGNTSRQDLPYNPGGTGLRRVSWRDLNGQ